MTIRTKTKVVSKSKVSSDEKDDPLFVQSVEKALRVLTAFDAERPTLSLSQLAIATGMDISTAQRFSHTLQRLGYLSKDPRTKHFELTTRTLKPAYHYTQSNALVRLVSPYLIDLRRETGEAVSFSVLEGTNIVYVIRLLSSHSLAIKVSVGAHVPAYCTAPGLAMLAHLPPTEARNILQSSNLRAYTERTETRIPNIMTRLREVSGKGYAVNVEEFMPNDITVAAAILGRDLLPVGAINIATTTERSTPGEAERRFAPLITALARAVSSR